MGLVRTLRPRLFERSDHYRSGRSSFRLPLATSGVRFERSGSSGPCSFGRPVIILWPRGVRSFRDTRSSDDRAGHARDTLAPDVLSRMCPERLAVFRLSGFSSLFEPLA